MEKLLICEFNSCNKYFVEPLFLPCGNNLCKKHIDDILEKNASAYFNCFFCNEDHEITDRGFPINSRLSDISNLNLHLNDSEKKARSLINKLVSDYIDFNSMFVDPGNFITEYFDKIKHKIDTERDRLISNIIDISNQMLDRLLVFENACRGNLKNGNELIEVNKNYLSSLSNNINEWKEELRIPNNMQHKIEKLIEEIKRSIDINDEKYIEYKKLLLNSKRYSFTSNNIKFDQKLFGELVIEDFSTFPSESGSLMSFSSISSNASSSPATVPEKCISQPSKMNANPIAIKIEPSDHTVCTFSQTVRSNSRIVHIATPNPNPFLTIKTQNDILKSSILQSNQFNELKKLCEFNVNETRLKLIYRASEDGFSAKDFHRKCDGISNTLTIIKAKDNDNVFGGYTNVSWDNTNTWKKDNKAFIFSLINKDKCSLKLKVTNSNYSINCHAYYGPVFGGGFDLCISSDSNLNNSSHSQLGNSYKHPSYAYNTLFAKCFLAGSYNFSTSDIEVYQVYF